jgi:hypothetical protein
LRQNRHGSREPNSIDAEVMMSVSQDGRWIDQAGREPRFAARTRMAR